MKSLIEKIISNVEKVIKGKTDIIEFSLIPLFAGGHLLFQDIPGVGKTTLAEAIARSIGGKFSRIQFTADLLPSDITGITIYHKESGKFEFKRGPLFANVILSDEINRASPKTQSALLEAMSEQTITIDNYTYPLPEIFFVIATENPYEFAGTYPLPESELDRFMISLKMGYPPHEIEKEIISEGRTNKSRELSAAISKEDLLSIKNNLNNIYTEASIVDYIMSIVQKTRNSKFISTGVSIRGAIEFVKAVKSFAIIKGRDFVIPEDVKQVAPVALLHRIIFKERETKFKEDILSELIKETQVPI